MKEAVPQILMIREAAAACGITAQILIDMQGPELRLAKMDQPMILEKDQTVCFREETSSGEGIPVPKIVYEALAVCDGASSVMVTGETAVGQYPVEVIRYLSRTVHRLF